MTEGTLFNTVLAGVLLVFGVKAPFPEFGGGMLLALGSCFAVRAFSPVEARRALGLSLFAAILSAVLVAALQKNTTSIWIWGGLPLQIQMAAAGMCSQAVFELVAARGKGVLGKLADKVGMSGGEK